MNESKKLTMWIEWFHENAAFIGYLSPIQSEVRSSNMFESRNARAVAQAKNPGECRDWTESDQPSFAKLFNLLGNGVLEQTVHALLTK